jgi:cytochrome P450
MDPPKHTHFRRLVSRAFTPRRIVELEAQIERLCANSLDRFVGTDGFDYVEDFAAALPPTVILALLGFPEEYAEEWRSGVDQMFHMEQGETGFTERATTEAARRVEAGGMLGADLFGSRSPRR